MGKVGVGTITPENTFQVGNSFGTDGGLVFWGRDIRGASYTDCGYLSYDVGKITFGALTASNVQIGTPYGVPRVTVLTTNGNVGINTIHPTSKLDVQGVGSASPIATFSNDENAVLDSTVVILPDGTITSQGKEVAFRDNNYAEMYMYDNVTACVIDNTDVYHAVYNSFGNNDGTLAPNRDATCFTYKAGAVYAIASVATYNGGTQIQCTVTAGHSLLAGEPITITNSANYNGTYLVLAAGLTATQFVVTKAYIATNTGSARKPATLKVLKTGIYHAEFMGGGVAVSANDIIKMELNKGITPLDNIAQKVEWTTNNRMIGASGLVSCTANDYIWLSVKNTSGTGDLTINTMNVNMFRK
jgi:hypothetical protein